MRYATLLLALTLAAAPPVAAQPHWPPDQALPTADDWIRLDSGEWLKGELIALYEDDLVFDSVKIGARTFDWKDIREVWTARTLAVGLIDGEILVGKLVVVGESARVIGGAGSEAGEQREIRRNQILSIAPGGSKPFSQLGGKISAGLTARQGNVDQIDANVSAEIEHRRVRDRVELDYFANYSSNEGTDTVNDQRIKSQWTHFITDRYFVKPAVIEWYSDPFQSLDSRTTAGAELGYQIFDTRRTEWQVSTGLAYQRTRWADLEAGEEENESSGAFVGSTSFEQEWTKVVDFNFDYTFYLTREDAGRYIHHALVSLETEWTDTLDLDVSLHWNRTQNPQTARDGTVPDQDDFRMVVSLGIEF